MVPGFHDHLPLVEAARSMKLKVRRLHQLIKQKKMPFSGCGGQLWIPRWVVSKHLMSLAPAQRPTPKDKRPKRRKRPHVDIAARIREERDGHVKPCAPCPGTVYFNPQRPALTDFRHAGVENMEYAKRHG